MERTMTVDDWTGLAAREAANIAEDFPPDPSRTELLLLLTKAYLTGAEYGVRHAMGDSSEAFVNLLDGVAPALKAVKL